MNSYPNTTSALGRAFAALLILASLGAVTSRADTPISMVTPEWVAEHNRDADLRILDVRPDPHDYFAGHVPGAVHIADGTLRGPLGGVPVQYHSPEVLAQLLARAGVTDDSRVVIYSDGENVLGATMAAYVLERLGHKKVMVMDGGWTAYRAAHKTTQQYPKYTPGKVTPNDVQSIHVTLDEVKKLVGKNGYKFIDARPEKAYLGQISTWMRNGHIPGAINLDWHSLVDSANPHKLKPLDEIKRIVAAKGINSSDDIVVYCGTSREASLEYVVLKHLLGFNKVRLYEGSWTEYSSHPELPMETR
jgi:thiosulfate/3-mercaptopyruvate sulfurtransferase